MLRVWTFPHNTYHTQNGGAQDCIKVCELSQNLLHTSLEHNPGTSYRIEALSFLCAA